MENVSTARLSMTCYILPVILFLVRCSCLRIKQSSPSSKADVCSWHIKAWRLHAQIVNVNQELQVPFDKKELLGDCEGS